MALNPNVKASFADHIDSFLEKKFLSRLEATLHLAKFGKKKSLPAHGGNTIKWNRFANFSANTTPLVDGTTPDGLALSSSSVSATVNQYGDYVTITDWFQLNAINDTQLDATDLLAYRAALSIDTLIRNELRSNGTQKYTSTNASQNDVETNTTTITSADLRKIQKALKVANVPKAMGNDYVGIINPLMSFDLLSESAANSFVILAANTDNSAQMDGEIGKAYGIRLFESTNIGTDTESNTYGNIFFGAEAFGTVDISSMGLKMYRKPMGSAGTEDPIDQRATIGYKYSYAAKVLEAVRVQVLWAYGI